MIEQPFHPGPGQLRQLEIYQLGLGGKKPTTPVSVDVPEQQARKVLKSEAFDYLAGGAGAEETQRANLEAFRRWRILPRRLYDVSRRDLSVELIGQRFPAPILLAPIGVQGILHNEGELAVARAARSLGMPFILSTVSSYTMEEVAQEMAEAPRWFQLYWPNNADLAASFLQRAERAGYKALVVTLDTFLLSWRERDIQNAYLPFLKGEGLANYLSDPVFRTLLGGGPQQHLVKAVETFGQIYSNPGLTWEDLPFLRQHTKLPILLKGILRPDDARKAVEHDMDGIIVSNHGGRQMDGAVAALEVLPSVVGAVAGRIPVLFDSGIRRGADVFRALALGAKAVLLGRPYCFGLAVNGEAGVRDVIQNLIADLDLTLGLAGCASLKEVGRDFLMPSPATPYSDGRA
jgi:isopentenyl diphosphate isomerase/L-lactate dehydrogenase-like FMN-dependent dehydrogenase